MEARKGVWSQGMPDSETFNRKFKNWHLPFSTLTKKKTIQVYFEFFLVKVVVDCFVLHFFSCKNKDCCICNDI